MKNHIEKYLDLYAEKGPWKLTANSLDGIHHAVVIPALSEYPTILETLHSLSLNSPEELKRTLVVCVVNNRALPQATEDEIANNRKTLTFLHSLIRKEIIETADPIQDFWIQGIVNSRIRLAYVDASSPGLELPEKAGVGLARKIGMDLALSLMENNDHGVNLLLSLDADTLVDQDYLHKVQLHFFTGKRLAAVVPFCHRKSTNCYIQDAIAYYEAYLRYYVLGLKHARSPYAFHTIGSTIVSSAKAYAMVRGMPKRLAAEDFYFLNKLSKIQRVDFVEGTTVYPSPRLSSRTPFGTGKKIGQMIEGEVDGNLFYHPEIFSVIRNWFILVESKLNQEGKIILAATAGIDPGLQTFLTDIGFVETWDKLKKNFPVKQNLLKQFHNWFDGLKTLKLIHYLTDYGYPKLAMSNAVEILKGKTNGMKTMNSLSDQASPSEILAYLRTMEKTIQQPGLEEISP